MTTNDTPERAALVAAHIKAFDVWQKSCDAVESAVKAIEDYDSKHFRNRRGESDRRSGRDRRTEVQ